MTAMWTLAIFLMQGGQAHLESTPDQASCVAMFQSLTTSTISPSDVERALCTSPNGRIVQWIVKDGKPITP